jgi:osmotically-inducible protein OsmY
MGWLGVGVLGLVCGCSREDADRIGLICQKAVDKMEAVSGAKGKAAGSWEALRGSLSDVALESRVAVRLRWDRALNDAEVRVLPAGPGTVRLRGAVGEEQRRRALELAQSTVGVDKVLDEFNATER